MTFHKILRTRTGPLRTRVGPGLQSGPKSVWSSPVLGLFVVLGLDLRTLLLMILFIIYNSDLVETAENNNELTLAFVDDTAFIAIGKDFHETHAILIDMLEREGGGYQWSKDHNSKFETSKFMLIDFSMNRAKERPPINIRGITIKPSTSHKFLGVILNQEL